MLIRQKITFFGRVQGVGFRYRAVQFAENIGLTGTVRHLEDGSVEIEAEGEEINISDFLDRLCHSSYITVTHLESQDIPLKGDTKFKIIDYPDF